jgi:hypothetical protein
LRPVQGVNTHTPGAFSVSAAPNIHRFYSGVLSLPLSVFSFLVILLPLSLPPWIAVQVVPGSACRFPVFPDRSALIGSPAPKIKKPALYREKHKRACFCRFFIPAFFNFLKNS